MWWHERNARLSEVPGGVEVQLLPTHVCRLLDEVEEAFASTGAGTPGWVGRPVDESPAREEYSRCLDPEKFRILPARAEAWVKVLVDRGWAERTEWRAVEQRGDHELTTTTTTLRPRQADAVPLAFTVVDSTDPEATLNVDICAGDSSELLMELPGCGCDACDSGSAWLLEELDQWALSVVDGSLIVDPSARLTVRTAFGGHGIGTGRTRLSAGPPVIVAAPWAPDWSAMRIPTGEDLPFSPGMGRGPRAVVGSVLRGLLGRLRGKPLPERGWTIYEPKRDRK